MGFWCRAYLRGAMTLWHSFSITNRVKLTGELQSQEDRHSCPSFLPDRNVWPPGLYDFAALLVKLTCLLFLGEMHSKIAWGGMEKR
jgi:hypothetical protein